MVRVSWVVPHIAKEASGPALSVRRMCDELEGCGSTVRLFTIDEPLMQSDLPTYVTPCGASARLAKIGASRKLRCALRANASENQVDILHSNGLWMLPGLYASWTAMRRNVLIVISPRGSLSDAAMRTGSPMKKVLWPLQRWSLKHADAIHVTSMAEYSDVRKRGFHNPVFLVPNGIDIPTSHSTDGKRTSSKNRSIVFCGRLHPIKGLDVLLDAWKSVKLKNSYEANGWNLRIIGPDELGYRQVLETQRKNLGLNDVTIEDGVFGSDKEQMLSEASVFILPSKSENFGMALAEAAAWGLPTITSSQTPWRILADRKAGWEFDGSTSDLARVLAEVLRTPSDVLAEMGARGRETMRLDFDWAAQARKLSVAYNWLVVGGARPDYVLVR